MPKFSLSALLNPATAPVGGGRSSLQPNQASPVASSSWGALKNTCGGSFPADCIKAMDELDSMVGLQQFKAEMLRLCDEYIKGTLSSDQGYLNYRFEGNPGTGKTTCAKLLHRILVALRVRKDRYHETTGGKAILLGPTAFRTATYDIIGQPVPGAPPPAIRVGASVFVQFSDARKHSAVVTRMPVPPSAPKIAVRFTDQTEDEVEPHLVSLPDAPGGVLLVDEAYALDPANNANGANIANQLLDAGEAMKQHSTIILAGYPREMEKFLAYNPGLTSRFPRLVKIDDFVDPELLQILEGKVQSYNRRAEKQSCQLAIPTDVAHLLVRRVSRHRGSHNYGNARTLEGALSAAIERGTQRVGAGRALSLTAVDVLGVAPKQNPKVVDAVKQLDKLTGIPSVKKFIHDFVETQERKYQQELKGEKVERSFLNRVFVGKPGLGKTTVARIYATIVASIGLISRDEVVEKKYGEFIGSHVGESTRKTNEIFDGAQGKVLFIDEASKLSPGGGAAAVGGGHTGGNAIYSSDVLKTMVDRISGDGQQDLVVIMAGYKEGMDEMFRQGDEGLAGRMQNQNQIVFEDFTTAEFRKLVDDTLTAKDLCAEEPVIAQIVARLEMMKMQPGFRNAGTWNQLFQEMVERRDQRLGGKASRGVRRFVIDDLPPPSGGVLTPAELEAMIASLPSASRAHVRELQEIVAVRRREGKSTSDLVCNYQLLGPPGTGKTESARKLAKIFHAIGLLPTNNLVGVSAATMQGQFAGSTPAKVHELVHSALGGVLFIDEAYTLGEGAFGKEVLTTLLEKSESPQVRGNCVIVLAGYEEEMQDMMQLNPGLESRFPQKLILAAPSDNELANAVIEMVNRGEYSMRDTDELRTVLRNGFADLKLRSNFGNFRDCSTVCKEVKRQRDLRVSRGHQDPSIIAQDFVGVFRLDCFTRRAIIVKGRRQPDSFRSSCPIPPVQQQVSGLSPSNHQKQSAEKRALAPTPRAAFDEFSLAAATDTPSDASTKKVKSPEESMSFDEFDEDFRRLKDLLNKGNIDGAHRHGAEEASRRMEVLKQLIVKNNKLLEEVENKRREEENARRRKAQEAERKKLREEREAAEKLAAEARKLAERARDEERKQQQLRRMGKCPMGYSWKHTGGSRYVCEGGSHTADLSAS